MKKSLLSTAAITALGMFAGSAQAQVAATTMGTAKAAVVSPLQLEQKLGIDFGTFSINSAGTVGTPGTPFTGYRVGVVAQPGSTAKGAVFEVSGEGDQSYAVVPISPFSITNGEDYLMVHPMVPTDILSVSDGGFYIGAVLSASGDEGPGLYSGEYVVTITYQ